MSFWKNAWAHISEWFFRRWQAILGQRWINLGLRAKMSAMVIIGLLGLLTTFSLLGISTTRQVTRQVLSERVMLARLSANSLDSKLDHGKAILTLLANQAALRKQDIDASEVAGALGESIDFEEGIFLIDQSGRVLAARNHQRPDINWLMIPAVNDALRGEAFNISILEKDVSTSSLALIAIPVRNEQGQVHAALTGLINLSSTNLFTPDHAINLGQTGSIELIDSSGQVLVSAHPERRLQNPEREALLERLFRGGETGIETCWGCYETDDLEAKDEVIAFSPLQQVPWGIVVRQKADEVFSPVRRLTMLTLILGAATVVGAMGLVWVTTNSVIRPVQMLTAAAQRIAEGDLTTPVQISSADSRPEVRRGDEIGALAASFQIMRRRLKESMDEVYDLNRDLDKRVQERTQEARQAQLEAQAARDDLRAIIDALDDELIVVGVEDHRVQLANRKVLERLKDPSALQELDCQQILRNELKCCSEKDCNNRCGSLSCNCPIPKIIETGKSVRVTQIHRCTDRSQNCYIDVVASPMKDANGNITRVVELIRDVTEERKIRESLERKNQQLSILNAIAMTTNQSLDLGEILGRALDQLLKLTSIDAGAVFLQEDLLKELSLVAYRGLSEETANLASRMGMLDGACGGVMEKGHLVIVPDLSRYRGKRARSLRGEQLNTLVHVPLVAKGSVLGSMCVATRNRHEFSTEEQELLSVIGSQIAVAVENARLYAEVQRKEQLRGELFKKAIFAQEEERKRIARELHDDTSQALAAMMFAAEESQEMDDLTAIKQRLEGIRDLAQHTLDNVHKIIFDLRPSMLDHLGLVPALRWLAASRLESKGIRVTIEEISPQKRLPAELETALFRVVQEAITNIARHAAARTVAILLYFYEKQATISIEDDGIGFDLEELTITPDSSRGLGLLGMQERVELMGGELEINSTPNFGTQVHIRVPLNGHESEVPEKDLEMV